MGDHFALLVDRLLTESMLQAAVESGKEAQFSSELLKGHLNDMTKGGIGDCVPARKSVECRICQEDDEDHNMEVPCSCSGSLKYAHRKCIQRWCNEKGDTVCEICLQQFRHGYTAPPKLFHYGSIPMNFRGNWEIMRQNLRDSQIITMVPSDRGLPDPEYENYGASSARSMIYCRSVAAIFILLLVLRHTLPVILSGAEEYSFTLVTLLLLRVAGILVLVFLMVKALSTFQRGRRQRVLQEAQEVAVSHGETTRLQSLLPQRITQIL